MSYASLTDDALKRRLEAQNYPVPPITGTTRGVLLKKLEQLEKGNRRSKGECKKP